MCLFSSWSLGDCRPWTADLQSVGITLCVSCSQVGGLPLAHCGCPTCRKSYGGMNTSCYIRLLWLLCVSLCFLLSRCRLTTGPLWLSNVQEKLWRGEHMLHTKPGIAEEKKKEKKFLGRSGGMLPPRKFGMSRLNSVQFEAFWGQI